MSVPRLPGEKVLERPEAVKRFGRPREEILVFTNGCFDLLHRGHVEYLDRARRLGDALVVGLNTDASVRTIKGPGRPVVAEGDRARVLAALECVDAVVLFAEETPRTLIAEILPDVLVKGGDYRPEEIAGHAQVRAAGGRVEVLSLIEGRSTTLLLERIRGAGETDGDEAGRRAP
ncbi:MAG TPA: D-glycero-beta-D-manno-heptose 1-phosphate adenylyltransferase [Longimicrobiales bacterium]|nr:D-glycero-beta-D-manno-heptose 1-phosphate adenylyltransferase [Longimicrobiales bacterium]